MNDRDVTNRLRRRSALRAGGVAVLGGLAGCVGLSGGPPDVETHTGLDRDTSTALDETSVALAGDAESLPDPPTATDSLADAEVALATRSAATSPLAKAFRDGTTVAFAGDGVADALASLLTAVRGDYHYGIETVEGRPVETTVAVPRGDVVNTYVFVREGGWDDPVLDPLGWVLDGRIPECETFVPERSDGEQYASMGSAWIAGRLPSGETYASRTNGSRYTGDGDVQRLRLRTTVHAAANEGYAVERARRVADFPNDESLSNWFPNPHERDGVEVSNHSEPVAERFDVSFSPTTSEARGALTGCGGVTVDGAFAYDHRTSWTWTNGRLLGSESHYGGGMGRGTWHVRL